MTPVLLKTSVSAICTQQIHSRFSYLEGFVRFAISILLGLLLLRKMTLAVGCDTSHMSDIILIILGRILLWILLQDLDDLATTSISSLARLQLHQERESRFYLSWPIDSPEPSSLL